MESALPNGMASDIEGDEIDSDRAGSPDPNNPSQTGELPSSLGSSVDGTSTNRDSGKRDPSIEALSKCESHADEDAHDSGFVPPALPLGAERGEEKKALSREKTIEHSVHALHTFIPHLQITGYCVLRKSQVERLHPFFKAIGHIHAMEVLLAEHPRFAQLHGFLCKVIQYTRREHYEAVRAQITELLKQTVKAAVFLAFVDKHADFAKIDIEGLSPRIDGWVKNLSVVADVLVKGSV